MKKTIKLTESEFHNFIRESVARLLKEDEITGDIPLTDEDVPDIPEEDDTYDGIGSELSQEERWNDYDKAEEELANDGDWFRPEGEEIEPLDTEEPTDDIDELGNIVSEAIKRVLNK